MTLPLDDLRAAGRLVRRTLPGGGEVELVEKQFHVCAYDPQTRSGDIVASDETVDRYGDVIEAAGWRLDAYNRNPVMVVNHSYDVESIVGQGIPRVEGGKLMLRFTLDPPGTNFRASIVANLLANRSLRAVSVGFMSHGKKRIVDDEGNWTGGFRFTDQELLEVSWVAVPANPNAVFSIQEPEFAPESDASATKPVHLALAGMAARARR